MVPSTGAGAVDVVVVVDEVTLGGVVLPVEAADVAGGGVGAVASFLVQPARAATAVRAAMTAKAVRLGVVVVLITVSLPGPSAVCPATVPTRPSRVCMRPDTWIDS